MARPKWLRENEPVRKKSDRLVKQMAKKLKGGRTTINSGATFSQNDVITDDCDIEHKFTEGKSYQVKAEELEKLRRRSKAGKIPVFVIEFISTGKKFVVVDYNDFFK